MLRLFLNISSLERTFKYMKSHKFNASRNKMSILSTFASELALYLIEVQYSVTKPHKAMIFHYARLNAIDSRENRLV